MFKLGARAVAAGEAAALFTLVPSFTARRVEAAREAAFQAAVRGRTTEDLPPCPLPGPDRDAFLRQSQKRLRNIPMLWVPVCRIATLPPHRIAIVSLNRQEFSLCSARSAYRATNVLCVVQENLGFLADLKAPRTFARREQDGRIWVTSSALSWEGHLVAEHRRRGAWALLAALAVGACVAVARRTARACAWRRACHPADDPAVRVPAACELLLHFVLDGRCRSLPGDLSQEYLALLDSGRSLREAGRWYRWQVFHSTATMLARFAESALGCRRAWGEFTRRG
jgi:hypothetical protein